MAKPVRIPRVLIVAGSDSGGGAGIQADIKSVMAMGGYAGTAITALTAQNTLGVHGVHPVPNTFVAQQMVTFLDDIGADSIKTGMLNEPEVIRILRTLLTTHSPNIPLILDPVMVAKGGARLLKQEAVNELKKLFPRARLLTPNIPEAEVLTGQKIETREAMLAVARILMEQGPQSVLLKGGHMDTTEIYDILIDKEAGEHWYMSPRILSPHTHGTGCTLASAIATLTPKYGGDIVRAVRDAREYVLQAIKSAPGFGGGHGPLNHLPPALIPKK